MRDLRLADHLHLLEANSAAAGGAEEPNAVAEQDRHDVQPDLVEQVGPEERVGEARAADDVDALVPAAARARATARSTPSVTTVKAVGPSGTAAGASRCVTTNAGTPRTG
jgi:hypothetical protein